MNSYPVHFLNHLLPLLFVGGLEEPPPLPTAVALKPPTGDDTTTPSIPDAAAVPPEASSEVDPFEELAQRLRMVLAATGQAKVWEPEGRDARKQFRIVLVDKDIRLPPVKVAVAGSVNASSATAHTSQPPRSPLSPYTPTSPLYPDGLIAPIWVRKHTDLVPSVFVLFLRLSEDPETDKAQDDALIRDLVTRRKVLADRGIKLTIVLIASRELLDDPSLDPRLSQIRRQSALDSRASLFVLTPVSPAELQDFVKSLQEVLYDAAILYYDAHFKRVRRKRARLGPAGAAVGSTSLGKGLSREGWITRYEYKAGAFAEIRGDIDVARKHYEDCWNELSLMFNSPKLLPPRTKRWAEAKVLADSLTIKICKHHLYQGDTSRALAFFRRHLRRFEELSKSWGIGEETFEFWSWVARQYRVLAELLELSGIAASEDGFSPVQGMASSVNDFLNPSLVLQHTGWYWYASARCSVRRKETFQAALAAEEQAGEPDGSPGASASTSPAFPNEKNVDHSALIVELFTKSYELMKDSKAGQSRTTLYIAYRIAEAYRDDGRQLDTALRFFERISKLYRKERWDPISTQIRKLWMECAREAGRVADVARLLLEEISEGTPESTLALETELAEILTTTPPQDAEPLVAHARPGGPLLLFSAAFWSPSALAGEDVAFQVSLTAPAQSRIASIAFSSVRLEFSEEDSIFEVSHRDSEPKAVQVVNLNAETERHSANLRWRGGDAVILSGKITLTDAKELEISRALLRIADTKWDITLACDLASDTQGSWLASLTPLRYIGIERPRPTVTTFTRPPHRINVDVSFAPPAYVGETFPVSVSITNEDALTYDLWLDVLLSASDEHAGDAICVSDVSSRSFIKRISLGSIQPNANLSTSILFLPEASAGERILDLSVTSCPTSSAEDASAEPHFDETVKSISIACEHPLSAAFDTKRSAPREMLVGLLDPASYEEDSQDVEGEVVVSAKLGMKGSWPIIISSIEFTPRDARAKISLSSTLSETQFPLTWETGSSFSIVSLFDLISDEDDLDEDDRPLSQVRAAPSGGFLDVAWRRKSHPETHPVSHTIFPLPTPPPSSSSATGERVAFDTISATLSALTARPRVLQPFGLRLVLHNFSPTRRSAALQVQVESSDAFAWAGPRQSRLPALLAGQSQSIEIRCTALRPGWLALPNVRVWELLPRDDGVEDVEPEAREVNVAFTKAGDGSRQILVTP